MTTRRLARAATALLVLGLALTTALPAAAADEPVTLKRVLRGYDNPILVTHDGSPARRLFVVEQTGRVRVAVFRHGAWRKRGIFLDLSGTVLAPPSGGSEQGLLGLAFAPDYATSGRFYVNYTRRGGGGRRGDTVVAEYRRRTALRADATSGRRVLVVDQPYDNHNGGHLAFGPDGLLYVGMGDGGSGGDPDGNGQDLSSRLGKLLRLDPRDPDGAGPARYRVPADNPYAGRADRALVWLSGVRNPWRFSFDRLNGDLWIGDVGQGAYEEIDHLPATGPLDGGRGRNLGWNVCEGDRTYPDDEPCPHAADGFTAPVFTYRHDGSSPMDGGCSVTGGVVVRASAPAEWLGRYLFADFCSGKVGVLGQDGSLLHVEEMGLGIASFGEDAAGRVYAVSLGGDVFRVLLATPTS